MSKMWWVYRFYSEGDQLFYVGVSGDPFRRLSQHFAEKPWWSDVARIECNRAASLDEAVEAEHAQIVTLSPLHNKTTRRSGIRRVRGESHTANKATYRIDSAALRAGRIARSWTQGKLSEESGVSTNTINRLERSERTVVVSTVIKLATALDVAPEGLATPQMSGGI